MHDASVPSLWMRDAHPLATDPLAHDAAADVCVVGAGIAGLTAAYLLLQEGSRVVVIDSGAIGGGQTARTTAHLASGLSGRMSAP